MDANVPKTVNTFHLRVFIEITVYIYHSQYVLRDYTLLWNYTLDVSPFIRLIWSLPTYQNIGVSDIAYHLMLAGTSWLLKIITFVYIF